MKNMEREKFEESWKRAFDKAEVTPSEQVWNNIELDLEKAKGNDLRKRLMFYKLLAAASVVFAMAVGGVGYYNAFRLPSTTNDRLAIEERSPDKSATTDTESSLPATDNTRNDIPADNGQEKASKKLFNDPADSQLPVKPRYSEDRTIAGNRNNTFSTQANEPRNFNTGSETTEGIANQGQLSTLAGTKDGSALPQDMQYRTLPPLHTPRPIQLVMPAEEEKEIDPVVKMLAGLEQREKEIRGTEKNEKESDRHENLWTSVGFAAGSFKSVQSAASGSVPPPSLAMNALTTPIVDRETSASGYSYSMGVNVGTRISEKWVLQGGVNYLSQSSEYTANNVVVASTGYQQQRFRAMSTNELINADAEDLNNKILYSAPYGVNNSMRYLSIPMQAGYLLIDKTFGLQLNAGVATDLFLQNTISADSDHLEKTSQPVGSDSPYRAVNLSGLLGTEFSYRFGENYRISLNPGIRYPFNTIYKSELGVQSTPLTFDVGLRFRYIFN